MWQSRLEIVDEIGSTSDALKARVEAGVPGEMALLARRQTGGRGRLGRSWRSPAGNLSLSVLLRPATLRFPGHWSILAAVAVADAVRPYAGTALLRLKWPNDVLLGGGKLAGILLEAGLAPSPWLVIGMGVNLQAAPELPGRITAALGPGAPPPEVMATDLLARLGAWRTRYEAEGFGPVREAWLLAGHAAGEALAAGSGGRPVAGAFAGLAEDGALLLDTEAGRIVVRSGEIE